MTHPAAEKWTAEIVGYTAPEGPQAMQRPVPLDAEACVAAKFVTHRGSNMVYEWADVTALVSADNDSLAMIARLTTRLAREAFEAGVRWQQQRVAHALGMSLTAEGD